MIETTVRESDPLYPWVERRRIARDFAHTGAESSGTHTGPAPAWSAVVRQDVR